MGARIITCTPLEAAVGIGALSTSDPCHHHPRRFT